MALTEAEELELLELENENALAGQARQAKQSSGFLSNAEAGVVPAMAPPMMPGMTPGVPRPPVGVPAAPSMSVADEPKEEKTLKGFAANAGKDLKDLVRAIPALVKLGFMPPEELGPILKDMVWEAVPHPEFNEEKGKIEMTPGAVLSRAKDIVTNPIDSLYKNPIMTPLDVASVAMPALKGTKAGTVALEAAEAAGRASGITKAVETAAAIPGKVAGAIGRKALSAGFGPSEEAIAARLARNAEIVGAKPYDDLAEDLAKSANDLSEQIKKYDKKAWDALSTSHDPAEGAIPREDVLKLLKQAKRDAQVTGGGAIGPAQKKAIQTIDQIIKDAQGLGGKVKGTLKSAMGVASSVKKSAFFSQAQIREMIQAIRKNVSFTDDTAELTNDVVRTASESLDELIKTKNPEYANRMIPVAERTAALRETERMFSLRRKPGEGVVPKGDTTATKLKTAATAKNKGYSKETLEGVKKFTGSDILQKAKDYATSEEFVGGSTQGSRRTVAGATLGGLSGYLFGGPGASGWGTAAGVGAGLYLDKQGRRIAGQIIDAIVKRRELLNAGKKSASVSKTPLRELLYLAARTQTAS